MIKAVFKGKVIAESNDTIVVEGNHYFPLNSINADFLEKSNLTTTCPWKGTANYYNLKFEGEKTNDMIWYYANPSEAAKEIKDRIAFYKKGDMNVIED